MLCKVGRKKNIQILRIRHWEWIYEANVTLTALVDDLEHRKQIREENNK